MAATANVQLNKEAQAENVAKKTRKKRFVRKDVIQKNNIPRSIIFSVLTLGLFLIYWKYQLLRNIKAAKKDKSGSLGEMLCLVFVPFYSLYWWMARGKDVRESAKQFGYSTVGSEIAYVLIDLISWSMISAGVVMYFVTGCFLSVGVVACLLIGVVGFGTAAVAIMQSDFNALELKPVVKAGLTLREDTFGPYMRRYWQLYALLALPLLYLLVFKYFPMVYIQIAFKKYKLNMSVWEMPWAKNNGFEFFIKAFKSNDFKRALGNTLKLNILDLIIGFPAPIIFALILNELPFKRFKKTIQTVAYMPHFLSWVIISSLALQLFAPGDGLVNMVIERIFGESYPFLNQESSWVGTYIGVGVWQSFGWNSIVYLAAIAGINQELYEAADVDGAGRFRKMWNITLPSIRPTIVVLLIMNLGNILGGGFDRPFAMSNNLVLRSSEVIATYVYKTGIKGLQFSLTTAVGLFQSVVGVFFLLMANWLSRKLGERGIW